MDCSVVLWGVSTLDLTNSELECLSQYFAVGTASLVFQNTTTVAYYPVAHWQVNYFNRTIVVRLKHHFREHETAWELQVDKVTNACKKTSPTINGIAPFSLPLYPLSLNQTKIHPDPGTSDNLTKLLELDFFRNQLLCQMDAFHLRTDTKSKTTRSLTKCYLDRAVWSTLQFILGQHFFVDRQPGQMTRSGRMADMSPVKSLLMTIGPFKVIYIAINPPSDGNGIYNKVSVDRVTLLP